MRFLRTPSWGDFEDTRRKRLALARKQRLEREAFPLLATLIAEAQPDADTIMAQRAVTQAEVEQRNRDNKARKWRAARARLSAFSDNERAILRHAWNSHRWLPGDPGYLLDMLQGWSAGRLHLHDDGCLYASTPAQEAAVRANFQARQAARLASTAPVDQSGSGPPPLPASAATAA